MILTTLLVLPLLAALLLWLVPKESSKHVALLFSLVEAGLAIYTAINYFPSNGFQLVVQQPWIKSFGIDFHLGIDGIGIMMVLLGTVLVPLIILSSYGREISNAKGFYSLMMIMQTGMLGVFMSLDAFLFYVCWELALIPIYFICGIWGGDGRIRITLKFFLYTVFGSLFMLAAIIYLYLQTPAPHQFDLQSFYTLSLSETTQGWIFWGFFIAFAIKMPLFPFHTWQPDTYTTAPTQGTMLLSGIMLKMGIYGAIRWLIPIAPAGANNYWMVALVLSIIGIVYASIIAIQQKDVKRLIAYSSIAHVGLIAAGIFSLNPIGLQGAIIQMVNHGINVVAMFFVVDILFNRLKTHQLEAMGGIASVAPKFAVAFLVVLLANVALPLTNGFVGEFLLIMGVFAADPILATVAGLTIILGAVYMLRVYQLTMHGESNALTTSFVDLKTSEKIFFYTVFIAIIGLGVYPKILMDITEPAVAEWFQLVTSKMVVVNN